MPELPELKDLERRMERARNSASELKAPSGLKAAIIEEDAPLMNPPKGSIMWFMQRGIDSFSWLIEPNVRLIEKVLGTRWGTVGFLFFAVVGGFIGYRVDHATTVGRDYTAQMDELKRVQGSLDSLKQFVAAQEQSLKDTQQTVDKLREDEKQLKPLVQTDRQTVETVLRAYSYEQSRTVWKERGIGFISGVFGSLLATMIYAVVTRGRRRSTDLGHPEP